MVALSTFASEISGRKVILYSDNVGAEKSTAKGSANAFDHNRLVHEIWTMALLHRQSLAQARARGPRLGTSIACRIRLWIMRVPTKDNIADAPSRFSYELLEELDGQWRTPVVADVCLGPGALDP